MKKRSKGKRVNRQSAKTPKVAMPPLPLSLQPPFLTDQQRADLRTGVRKSVVISPEKIREALAKRGTSLSAFGARMVGEVIFPMAKKMGAASAIRQRDETIRELKRQVRVLRAELDCQRAMWEDALAGDRAVLELRGAPRKLDRNVKVAVSFMSSGAQHAELALEQSRKDHKRRRRREPDVRKMWKQAGRPAAKTPKRKK